MSAYQRLRNAAAAHMQPPRALIGAKYWVHAAAEPRNAPKGPIQRIGRVHKTMTSSRQSAVPDASISCATFVHAGHTPWIGPVLFTWRPPQMESERSKQRRKRDIHVTLFAERCGRARHAKGTRPDPPTVPSLDLSLLRPVPKGREKKKKSPQRLLLLLLHGLPLGVAVSSCHRSRASNPRESGKPDDRPDSATDPTMSEDDIDLAGQDGQGPGRVDRDRRAPRFSWTPAYEATFFRSLCESVQLGMRENSSFKAEAWERAAQALQEHHGAYPAKSHLINKSDNARKRFRLWRGLREDPEFLYNSVSRTVTATEEAWRAHIEREPLSRALRGRPFDHEEYMEVLYPDVVGSGGAPKRIMKPRRKTDGQPCDEAEMPGTGVLNLQTDSTPLVQDTTDGPGQPPPQQQKSSQNQASASSSSASGAQQRPTTAPSVPRNLTAGQASALTPPEESVPQSRKRPSPMSALHSTGDFAQQTSGPALPQPALPSSPEKRRRMSSRDEASASTNAPTPLLGSSALPATVPKSTLDPRSRLETHATGIQSILEELVYLSKASRSRMWREEAVDLLFKDFADEDAELQIKISESVLSDEHKAMVFCKMPSHLREHWVKKLRGTAT
ncbi:hypothetical protein TARUN_147 [Trichoderma arundinaceum]|uniref:Myb/SANT-like domain-containing protein n=1 Tax=Trichoderma arundinaceum TaxID=490622 RepID=A0A395P252_TRIAR|nr:hypothetical protein TARUN_147 [Trichoderma arundinaceum]